VPAISVIIPARDAAATIGRTLDALATQRDAPEFEVIVVDNGSLDDTADIAERHSVVSQTLRRERGTGPGPARNDGAAAARAPVLAFTDADCAPCERWVAAGAEAIQASALVQGRVDPDPAATVGPWDRTLWVGEDQGLYQTANLFVTMAAFKSAGGFPDGLEERDGAPFGEDVLLGWAVRRGGGAASFSSDALVHHAVFPRDFSGYVRERRRYALFPALARAVPELRDTFFHRGWFMTRRTALFDAALAGVTLAVLLRRTWLAAAALPYVHRVGTDARQRGPRTAALEAGADVSSAAALVRGSTRARTPVL
jgi:glycosyltransferase involved in cell wall biosynthesis